jgi:hypothetical protein
LGRDDELVAMLQAADDPTELAANLSARGLRRLARSYGLYETVGGGRYFNGRENGPRVALAERLRRASLPHRQHAGRPVQLPPDAAALLRAELLRQAEVVRVATPEALRAALAALELLLVVVGQVGGGNLGETDRAQLLADVRALLTSPREATIVAQARTLAGLVVALLS